MKEKSYDFETLHVVLSNQKNKNGTLKKILIPPFQPPLWYISRWISALTKNGKEGEKLQFWNFFQITLEGKKRSRGQV